ncbi:MAG: deoxynucleoside kinase [Nitrospinae bacterium]|nr:deoxynucleoside kinase [Nitrospinota bacterium]
MGRYIAIDGPIGVGKSSLVRMLGERFGVEPVYEQVEENTFLGQFYKDHASYAFHTQMFFLISRYKQLSMLSQVDLFNQVTLCDYTMERDLIFAGLNLDQREYNLYLDVYRQMVKSVPTPDLVVYLQADTPTLLKRVRQRGRTIEKEISDQYLERVNRAFSEYFFNYRRSPLLVINTTNIDFVANSADFENLVKKMKSDVQGHEYFNPPRSVF